MSFLDQALDRQTGDSDPLGIERRRTEDVDAGMGDLDPFDGLAEEGEDAEVAAGPEYSTSAFAECSVH